MLVNEVYITKEVADKLKIIKEFDDAKIYAFTWNGEFCWIANQVLSIFHYVSPKKNN